MMNIFIMVLVSLFMVGYYLIAAPGNRVEKHETEYAVMQSDLRSIAECAAAAHNAQMRGNQMDDICMTQVNVTTNEICLNEKMQKTKCESVRNKKPEHSYIITTTAPIADTQYNHMMEVLEKYYANAGAFGLAMGGKIISGGTANKRTIPNTVIEELGITDGQLIYMTQYEIPDDDVIFADPTVEDVICPAGTTKTYRFGRWQCIGMNTKTDCGGDMIWDSDLLECVPDESRKPLCAGQQTAVLVDEVWQCINPFPEKLCPDDMVARLNYNTLEWECVTDPTKIEDVKKCEHITGGAVYGAVGTTLRVPTSSCTDCEKMVIDYDTCKSICVPDASQINNPSCYPAARECAGPTRAFYFGFPSAAYANQIPDMNIGKIPIDANHSQNRRFNCLDCGDSVIDTERSTPPYTAVCK